MRCSKVLTMLDEFRTQELEPKENAAIADHLSDCTPCEESLDEIAGLAGTLSALQSEVSGSCIDCVREELYDGLGVVATEAGEVRVAFSGDGITMTSLRDEQLVAFCKRYVTRYDRGLVEAPIPPAWREQVVAALEGHGPLHPDVDLSHLDGFQKSALEALLRIPRGEVRTYAWVAREAGKPKAIRAAASACARNPLPFVVPCHRVVPSSGGTGNYFYGPEMKRELLDREGALEQIDRFTKKGARYVASRTTGIYCFPTCRDARRIRDTNQVLLRDERAAIEGGFRPCHRCRPLAA